MARRPSAIPTVKLTTTLPLDVHSQLTLHLHSDLEGRVPPGAYQSFLAARIREYFSESRLDLSPYLGSLPGDFQLHGSPAAISALIKHLKGA